MLAFERLVGVVAAAIFVCGCSPSPNKDLLVGSNWTSEAGTLEQKPVPDGYSQIRFAADRTFTYQIGDGVLKGTYKVGSDDTLTLYYEPAVKGRRKHVYTIRLRDQQLELSDADGNLRKFRKAS